jgi:hypothetical protein
MAMTALEHRQFQALLLRANRLLEAKSTNEPLLLGVTQAQRRVDRWLN